MLGRDDLRVVRNPTLQPPANVRGPDGVGPSLLLRIEGARLYLPFISRYTLTSRTLLAPKTQNRLPFYRGDVHQILYGTTIQQDPKTETP